MALALLLAGWRYSDQILGPDRPGALTGQRILSCTDSTVVLEDTPKARRPGRWAIQWPGGFGHLGPILSLEPGQVVSAYALAGGSPPDSTCRLAGFARDADPRSWLGFEFEPVAVPARIGPLPSWYVPGADSTWAIFVHGRAATRAEVLRMLPFYASAGLPCLVISYRNSPEGPRVGDGSYRLGATEWQDLEDAVRFARARGARDVIVVGCSMGGAIVGQFLLRSELRAAARGAVLDAPALDWRQIVRREGMRRRIPAPLTEWALIVAQVRGGLRWDELSLLERVRELTHPVLVFHGDADDVVPVELSLALAKAAPALVTRRVTSGAGHVESVNLEPEAYASAVHAWLRERGLGLPRP